MPESAGEGRRRGEQRERQGDEQRSPGSSVRPSACIQARRGAHGPRRGRSTRAIVSMRVRARDDVRLDQLGGDRDRDLLGRPRADLDPDRGVQPRELGVADAVLAQPGDAVGARLLAADRADEAGARARARG